MVLRLSFRLRGSARAGDVFDLIVEDAVFAASDESQSLAMNQGTVTEYTLRYLLSQNGINPDTDPRFIKNGNSAIDNLLTYYLEDQAMFEHGRGAGANAMATDQATYGLVAYDRLVKGKTALYDYSDVAPAPAETNEMMLKT